MASELITLGGIPLTGVDRNGSWKVNKPLDGWWDTPAPRKQRAEKTRGDGDFQTDIYYGPREINISGRVLSKSHDYLHQAAGIIAGLAFRGKSKLLVQGHGPTQWATVDPRPGSRITTKFVTDQFLQFEIPLESIDPFKYGESYTVAGSPATPAQLLHRGTADAWPVVTVTGTSATGYTLTLNGRSVVVTRALASSSPHTIDFKTGILRVGGSVARSGLSTANFSPIKPGLPQNMTISAGLFTAKYFDTFI